MLMAQECGKWYYYVVMGGVRMIYGKLKKQGKHASGSGRGGETPIHF